MTVAVVNSAVVVAMIREGVAIQRGQPFLSWIQDTLIFLKIKASLKYQNIFQGGLKKYQFYNHVTQRRYLFLREIRIKIFSKLALNMVSKKLKIKV